MKETIEKYVDKFNKLSKGKQIALVCCVGFVELIIFSMIFGSSAPETTTATNNTEINALQNIEDTTTKKSINTTDKTAEENLSAESSSDSVDNSVNSIDNSADQVGPTVTPEPAKEEPVYTPTEQTEKIVYVGNTGNKYHKQNCRTLKNGSYEMTLTDAQNEGREACKVCNP